jgi:hypothetical protein
MLLWVAVLLTVAGGPVVKAQETADQDSKAEASRRPAGGWMSFGIGAGSKGGSGAILMLTGRFGPNLVTLRLSGSEDVSMFASKPVSDYGVLRDAFWCSALFRCSSAVGPLKFRNKVKPAGSAMLEAERCSSFRCGKEAVCIRDPRVF